MNSDRVAILVKRAALEAEKIQYPILQKYDLTVSQYKFLKYLYFEPKDSARIADLEEAFSMTHPAAIDIIKVLEKKGYVTRIVNPADARSKIVSLTKKAYEQQEELEGLGDDMEEMVTKNLTAKEKKELLALLKKMLGMESK